MRRHGKKLNKEQRALKKKGRIRSWKKEESIGK